MSNAHVVFNESKVVNARLSVNCDKDLNKNATEMMILDLGEVLEKPCQGPHLANQFLEMGVPFWSK